MLTTKLILIEGLPGAGKSTTAEYLATYLQQHGSPCRWFHELDETHPVADLDVSINNYPQHMLNEWRTFVDQATFDPTVTIIESRLWQNTALFMYMSTYTAHEVQAFNQHVADTLRPLNPTLLYLVQDDTATALRRLYTFRGQEWMDWALMHTMKEHWFQSRKLTGFDGWVQFFESWLPLADHAYEHWPYPKIKIRNPHDDWPLAYTQVQRFLEI